MPKNSQFGKTNPKAEEVDLDPDAWPKFVKLIRSAAKLGRKPYKGQKSRDDL